MMNRNVEQNIRLHPIIFGMKNNHDTSPSYYVLTTLQTGKKQ
jgi:hypothetical protein